MVDAMNVFAEENDMRLRMHHWKENGVPKMIQPKKDGPDPVGIAVVLILLVCAILAVAMNVGDEGVPHSLRSGSGSTLQVLADYRSGLSASILHANNNRQWIM